MVTSIYAVKRACDDLTAREEGYNLSHTDSYLQFSSDKYGFRWMPCAVFHHLSAPAVQPGATINAAKFWYSPNLSVWQNGATTINVLPFKQIGGPWEAYWKTTITTGPYTRASWCDLFARVWDDTGSIDIATGTAKSGVFPADVKISANSDPGYWETGGQGFVVTADDDLGFIDLYVTKYGNPTGNIWINLFTCLFNLPYTFIASSQLIDLSGISGAGWRQFTFSPVIPVTTGVQRVAVLKGDYTKSSSNCVAVRGESNIAPLMGVFYGSGRGLDRQNFPDYIQISNGIYGIPKYSPQNSFILDTNNGDGVPMATSDVKESVQITVNDAAYAAGNGFGYLFNPAAAPSLQKRVYAYGGGAQAMTLEIDHTLPSTTDLGKGVGIGPGPVLGGGEGLG